MVISVIGSGGKTTRIFYLAKYYRSLNKKVFVTTSTHMKKQEDSYLCDDASKIIEKLNQDGYVFAGTDFNDIKMGPLSYSTYLEVCKEADIVLVESDGSRGLPIKYPNDTEPVIYDNTDKVELMVGLFALGKKAKDVVHRLSLLKEVYEIDDDTIIEAKHIQDIVELGYKKVFDKYDTTIICTNNGSLYERAISSMIENHIDVNLCDKKFFASKPHLFICGGGHVAKEVASLAHFLDLECTVYDDRKEFLTKDRFNHSHIIYDSFTNLKNHLIDDAYYVVLTRGHEHDYECVKTIKNSHYHYLGMIGSKTKVARTFENLKNEGYTTDDIHAPIGLKILAKTPAEIAISILGEIIAIKNQNSFSSCSKELLDSKEAGVLAIIIDKKGSSPRDIGSMMLINDHIIDTIGGGEIEALVIEEAKSITKPTVQEYHLDSSTSASLGMICGGYNKILMIPIKKESY